MSPPKSVSVFAPAKINLTLHVTGQRADGYHLLDTLVAFADVGDDLFIQDGNTLSLTIEGPEAGLVPADMDNLVLRVAALFEDTPGASILLTKSLPVSSGIGGGSADAAAAFRGLMALWKEDGFGQALLDQVRPELAQNLLDLGADIPMCLLSQCARVQGIGEDIQPISSLPVLHAVLVNPRCAVPTPAVFKELRSRDNPPMPHSAVRLAETSEFIAWLAEQRNDLEEPAIALEPAIGIVKATLADTPTCRLVRMSGSGATCFGLFDTAQAAQEAAKHLSQSHPDWWIKPTRLGSQTDLALPRVS